MSMASLAIEPYQHTRQELTRRNRTILEIKEQAMSCLLCGDSRLKKNPRRFRRGIV
jgi:hypothetical protein